MLLAVLFDTHVQLAGFSYICASDKQFMKAQSFFIWRIGFSTTPISPNFPRMVHWMKIQGIRLCYITTSSLRTPLKKINIKQEKRRKSEDIRQCLLSYDYKIYSSQNLVKTSLQPVMDFIFYISFSHSDIKEALNFSISPIFENETKITETLII